MRIGADYYPEHWEKERWKTDAEMMVKANIKVIRIGEFAWSLYEPEEGKYEFDWMDEALDFFGKYGIKVVMCTPSATPPKWMIDKYPDILQNDIHGNPKLFGTRKHYCFNSETYREKTKKLNEMNKNLRILEKTFPADTAPLAYSSLSGTGRDKLLAHIEEKICR